MYLVVTILEMCNCSDGKHAWDQIVGKNQGIAESEGLLCRLLYMGRWLLKLCTVGPLANH